MKKKIKRKALRLFGLIMLLMFFSSPGLFAQQGNINEPMPFTQEELDQMLAPIALYPDDLLSQILMASTYPLEVVQAARWVQTNPNLGENLLASALEEKDWDPSVKALVNFPSVLQMMNDRLEWMGALGDAFLGQPDQVMNTVQQLRQRARAQGHLISTPEQQVLFDSQSQAILVEPAVPQVIFVPIYDPLLVYGPWWWPASPPYFYHPRGVIIRAGFGFFPRVPLSVPWGYAWGGCDWRQHRVVVDITKNVRLNNRIDRNRYALIVTKGVRGRVNWMHDPDHRRGLAYRTTPIARQFDRGPFPGVEARRNFRGYDRPVTTGNFGSGIPRPGNQPHPGPPEQRAFKPEPFRQPPTPAQERRVPVHPGGTRIDSPRPSPTSKPQPLPIPSPMPARPAPPPQPGPTAFSPVGPKDQARQDSHRGHQSLAGPRTAETGQGANRPAPRGIQGGPPPQHQRGR